MENLPFPYEIMLKILSYLNIFDLGPSAMGPAAVGPAAVGLENLPFPNEILLKILSYLNIFDLAKCAQVSKQLMNVCEDTKFQQYRELKKMFKNSTVKLTANDFIMVDITNQEAINGIKEALKQNGHKIELVLEREQQFENGSRLFTVELYGVRSLKQREITVPTF